MNTRFHILLALPATLACLGGAETNGPPTYRDINGPPHHYLTRTALFLSPGKLTPTQEAELNEQARLVVRYLLYAGEEPLPAGGNARA